jgi:hypothetical protein
MTNPINPDSQDYKNEININNSSTSYIGESIDIDKLASEQGIKPINNFEDLLGDFWPENEKSDEFIIAVQNWKKEGNREK